MVLPGIPLPFKHEFLAEYSLKIKEEFINCIRDHLMHEYRIKKGNTDMFIFDCYAKNLISNIQLNNLWLI